MNGHNGSPLRNSHSNELTKLLAAIDGAGQIGIVTHVNPDADAIGSSCSLFAALQTVLSIKSEKKIYLLNESKVDEQYFFIPGAEKFSRCWPSERIDLLIALDCGDIKRTGDSWKENVQGCQLKINIDHHLSNDNFGDLNIVVPTASSTAEVLYDCFVSLGWQISPACATGLLTGLVGDTGSFRYSSTSARTFQIASELMECGASITTIARNLFGRRKLSAVRLQAEAMQNMELFCQDRLSMAIVTKAMLSKYSADPEDTEDLVERLRDIQGVLVSALIKYADGLWRVSLRSQDPEHNVSDVAVAFGGGGHRQAAAFRWRGELEELKKRLLEALTSVIETTP